MIYKQEGASLIEASIGIIVFSVLALPFFMEYAVSLEQEKIQGSEAKLYKIQQAINEYHENTNGAYPCPAGILLPDSHLDYGRAGDCSLAAFSSNDIRLCSNPTWILPENGSICKTRADAGTALIYGAVPFETLGLTAEDAVDYWDRRIHYKVTYEQTDAGTFASNNGQLEVWTADNPQFVAAGSAPPPFGPGDYDGLPDASGQLVDFVLYSSGENGYGGVGKDGTIHKFCGNLFAGDGLDNFNCMITDNAVNNAVLVTEDINTPGASVFSKENNFFSMDDLVITQENLPPKLFSAHEDNGVVATDPEWILSNINTIAVGIGTNLPDPKANLHVIGAVHAISTGANNGKIITPSVCGEVPNPDYDPGQPVSPTNLEFIDQCFDPNLIAGDEILMECDFDQTVLGLTQTVHTPAMGLWSNMTFCGSAFLENGATTEIINTQRGEAFQIPSLQNQSCATGVPTFINPAAGIITCP
ncbi:MAG: hypothetical protein GC137_04760 [Alphaproteobacteria bacterium]|nr:hypothetical protein [Alphaproteobacteria bacterium]